MDFKFGPIQFPNTRNDSFNDLYIFSSLLFMVAITWIIFSGIINGQTYEWTNLNGTREQMSHFYSHQNHQK
jgi:hypothetical protein